MKKHKLLLMGCSILTIAAVAVAQDLIPAVPPTPPVPPATQLAPFPPAPPRPPLPVHRLSESVDQVHAQMDAWHTQFDAAWAPAEAAREFAQVERRQAEVAREFARVEARAGRSGFVFAPQISIGATHISERGDRAYERGQRALDGRRWDEALQAFTEASGSGGTRADGALYWKAYTLGKLGRRDEAVAAIAELSKSYPSSRWLNDAKALELEVKQTSGQKVTPGAEDTEELKLLALNGLVQSDPERAAPLIENLLKTSNSPKLKERAMYVLAQSNSTRGRQLLEQVARGAAGNPDLQLKAISYLSASSKRTETSPLLWEIYGATSDDQVKRMILATLHSASDKEHLLQIARNEKSTPLRMTAISLLGPLSAQPELWQIYQGETSAEIKQQILHSMIASVNVERVVEIAKTEKDAKLRRTAIQALSSMRTASANEGLISLYAAETDAGVKKSIVQSLRSQNNAKALVDFARKESDPAMKREIVSLLSGMQSKEATDYLMELLK